jgi:hypothetical protein
VAAGGIDAQHQRDGYRRQWSSICVHNIEAGWIVDIVQQAACDLGDTRAHGIDRRPVERLDDQVAQTLMVRIVHMQYERPKRLIHAQLHPRE